MGELRSAVEIAMARTNPPVEKPNVPETNSSAIPARSAIDIAMAGESPWMTDTPVVAEAPVITEKPATGTPLKTAAELAMERKSPWMTDTPVVTEAPVVTEKPATGTPLKTAVELAMERKSPWMTDTPVVTEAPVNTELTGQELIDNLRADLTKAEEANPVVTETDPNKELKDMVSAQNAVIEALRLQVEALNTTLQELARQRTAPAPVEVTTTAEEEAPVEAEIVDGEVTEDNRTPAEVRTELRERRHELLENLANENDPARRQEILIELRAVMDGIDEQTDLIEADKDARIARQEAELQDITNMLGERDARIAELEAQLTNQNTNAERTRREAADRIAEQSRGRKRKLISMIAGVAVGAGSAVASVTLAPAILPAAVVTGLGFTLTGTVSSMFIGRTVSKLEQRLNTPEMQTPEKATERAELIAKLNKSRKNLEFFQNAIAFGGGMSSGILITRAIQSVAGIFGAPQEAIQGEASGRLGEKADPAAGEKGIDDGQGKFTDSGAPVIEKVAAAPVELSGNSFNTGLTQEQVRQLGWLGNNLDIKTSAIGLQQAELIKEVTKAGVDLQGPDSFANWQLLNGLMRNINASRGTSDMSTILPQALKLFGK